MKNNNLNSSIRQKRRIPRILSLVLALVMVITSVPQAIFAGEVDSEIILVQDAEAQGTAVDEMPDAGITADIVGDQDEIVIDEIGYEPEAGMGSEVQADDEVLIGDIEEIIDLSEEIVAEEQEPLVEIEPETGAEVQAEEGMLLEETEIGEEDVVVELGEGNEIMPVSMTDGQDLKLELYFADADTGEEITNEKLQFTGIYEGDNTKWDTCNKRTIAEKNETPEYDFSHINLTYSFTNGTSKQYLYIAAPIDEYEIDSWDIEMSDEEILGEETKTITIPNKEDTFSQTGNVVSGNYKFVFYKTIAEIDEKTTAIVRFKSTSSKSLGIPSLKIAFKVRERKEEESIEKPVILWAQPADQASTKIPEGKLELTLKSGNDKGQEYSGAEQTDKSIQLSQLLSALPDDNEDDFYTITVKQTGLVNGENEYRVSDWLIGEDKPDTSINAINVNEKTNPFENYGYDISEDGSILTITVQNKNSLKSFTVKPVLQSVTAGYRIHITTEPEAAGLRLMTYKVGLDGNNARTDSLSGGTEDTFLYGEEDIADGFVGWQVNLDSNYYKDAYENFAFSILFNEEVYKTVKFDETSSLFRDVENGWTIEGRAGIMTFSSLPSAIFRYIAKEKYDNGSVSAKITADKRDVPISLEQDRDAGASFSCTLKKGEQLVGNNENLSLSSLEPQTFFTLLAKDGAAAGEQQALLDKEADYQLEIKLNNWDQNFDFKNWTVNGKELGELGYPEQFQAQASEDGQTLIISAPGAYLPVLKIGAAFESALQMELKVRKPEGNDKLNYSLYLEDTADGGKRTLLNSQQEGSGYIERSFVETGHSYILRAEALRAGKAAGSRPDDDIYGSNYLCGWNVSDSLKALCEQNKENGWEIRPVLSEGYTYGYETLEVAFTGEQFLSYMESLKAEGREQDAVWEFQVLTDQITDDSSATYRAAASVNDSALGEAKAEFVKNTALDGDIAASVWNLKVKPESDKKALQYWNRKQNGTESWEKEEGSDGWYRYQVVLTEDTEYQAVIGELPIAFAGDYIGTFPVDEDYLGYSGSEWRKLDSIENGVYLGSAAPEYQIENSVERKAYEPAALLFQMDMPYMKGFDITFRFYKGSGMEEEPFKEAKCAGATNAGLKRILVGVDSLPDTGQITVTAEVSDGRTAQKTYLLYRRPTANDAEKGDYSQELRRVYEEGIENISSIHGGSSVYSSAYVMLRYEYQKAVAEIASLGKEEARARFEEEKTILENIGNEIIPEAVGIRVSGWNQVVAMPNGVTIEKAICALLEKANPGGWVFETYPNQFGQWVNKVDTTGGTGTQTIADKQKGSWQYRIRGYNKDKETYQEYAPLGVSSQIMLDGDFVTAGVGEREWALQCLGICRGKDAEAAERKGDADVDALETKYNVLNGKLHQSPLPKEITDWIDAINEIAPVTMGGSFGHTYTESLIKNTAEVAAKIQKADSLRPTGIYMERMSNSEWGKAISSMRTRFNALSGGKIEGLDDTPDDNRAGVQSYLVETAKEDETFGYGNEWDVFALAQSGRIDAETSQKYVSSLEEKLKSGIFDSLGDVGAGEELGGYTEYERVVLALTALGKDASSYTAASGETYDFIEKLLDYDSVTAQGLNAVDYALLALDAGGYDSGNQEIRRRYVQYILDWEIPGGGWNLKGFGSPETDMTAMTLQALAPYRSNPYVAARAAGETNGEDLKAKVEEAVERGLTVLQGMQSDLYGDFGYEGSYNAESTAQVLVALSALGIDGGTAEGWTTKYGGSVVAGLLHYYQEIEGQEGMGAFLHGEGGGINAMATQQAAYALEAYRRFKNREKSLYDMTDKVSPAVSHKYDVTVNRTDGGVITADPVSGVLPGAYVTVDVKTDDNYTFDSLKMNGKEIQPEEGTGAYKFLMPAAAAVVEAEFTIKEHDHTYDEGKVTKEAGCEKAGELTYTCTICGETKTEEIPATGHAFGEWTTTKEATETEKGLQERKCENCGEVESRELPSTGHEHSYDEGKVTQEAGCEKAGELTYTCTICGETKTEKIPATGHAFGEWTTTKEPTATEKGVQERKCGNCGEVESRELPSTGHEHSYDEGKVTKEAGCEEAGELTYTCTICGETKTEKIPATGHAFGEWTTTKEPTATEKGVQERKCEKCGEVESMDLPSTGHEHSYDEGKVTKEAGCEEAGELTYICTICGETKTEEILATGHAFGEWTTTKEPTATEKGVQERKCGNCGEVESRELPSTGHEHSYDEGKVTKEAECEKPGEMIYTCTECGETMTKEIPAMGHSFGRWITTKSPTVTEAGIQIRTCGTCGAVESREIPITYHDHSYGEGKVTKEAECEKPGEMIYTCTECGETMTKEIPATGHKFGSWLTTKEATATEDGVKERTCEECGAAERQVIPKEDHTHSYDKGIITKEPGCEESGIKTYTCTVCGETETEEIPETGHSFSKWMTTKEASPTEEGFQTRTCETCGMVQGRVISKQTAQEDPNDPDSPDEPYLPPAQYYDPYITLNLSEITLQTGQSTAELEVLEMQEDDSVKSWKSSDTKIAAVDKSGNIKAKKKAGTAIITVTTVNGAKATVKVVVRKAKVTAKKITGLKKKVTLKKGKTLKLKPVLKPAKAQDEITYKSSNSKIVKVNKNGKLKAKKKGTATVTVKAGKATAAVKVTVTK